MSDANIVRPKRVTAADVAAHAGVSRPAVSRAFTEGSYLDPAKRIAILQAAEELGYRPNALAAGLKGAQSNLVAIFVGEMPNEFDKEVATHLITGLNQAGKWPIMIGGSGKTARDAVSNVLRYPLEAMILRSGSLDEDIVNSCGKLSIPVISSGRILTESGVDNVCCRNSEGMQAGAELLLEKGRRKFGYVGGPATFWSAFSRRAGLCNALDAKGLELVAETNGDFTVQGGYDAAMRITENTQLDAIVCANDAMAIGALSALRETGRRVPEDISVIGFDDISMSAWPAFSLTTLHNPIQEAADAVLNLLERRGRNPDKPDEIIHLDTTLVLRNSH